MARRAAALLLFAGLFFLTFAAPVPAAASTPASLDSSRLSSRTGASETILHVPEIGRYAVIARSPTGATFEIVDRMAGRVAAAVPAEGVSGSTGRLSRVDCYLEPGEYKLRLAHAPAETVSLEVRRFDAVNAGGGGPASLPDGATDRGEIADLQLRQYWITVDAAHPTLLLEAWGRSLHDLVLWKDGTWDTGFRPLATTMELEPGKPLTVLELNARLEPGSYLVTCAGGAPAAWAKNGTEQPFWLTRGARFLGDLGRTSLVIPAQGTASFLVSGTVGTVEMQVKSARPYRLLLNGAAPGQGRYEGARQAGIDQKSTSLRCRVDGPTGSEISWVTVQGPAGETVDLTWLSPAGGGGVLRPFAESGPYLTTILSSMEGDNSVDATALILQANNQRGKDPLETKALQAVTVSPDKPFRRQVNCLGDLSFILQAKRGTYAVVEKDRASATATYSFRLLDDALLSGSVGPVQVNGGGRVTLTDKLYLVVISPVKAGVLDFAIVPTGLLGGARAGGVFSSPPPAPVSDISWPSTMVIQSGSSASYLVLPPRRDVMVGFVARKLPADLSQPLPFSVGPGQTATISILLRKDSLLASTSPAFSPAAVTVDSSPWAADRVYPAGSHTLAIRNPASVPQWHVIYAVEPAAPERPASSPSASPALPALTEGASAWLDFDRLQTSSFLLTVPAPGSYRIGTLGRLAMSVAVRTPLRPAFAQAAENVDGRNAEVISYLRAGTYLVQVASRGDTTGRAGVRMQRLPVAAAGTVRDGDVLRATVPEGQVMQADLLAGADNDYVLECLGLARSFAWRLEDADGWPIGEPVRQGASTEHLAAGTYRYLSLAMRESARRVLSFRAVERPAAFDPNARQLPLGLNQSVRKTWNERDGRTPDVFTLSLPAEVRATLSLTAGMLFRFVDARGAVPWQGIGGKPLPVDLQAGDWRLEITSLLEDNRKGYEIALSTLDLLPGTPQSVSASPQDLPVSVGAAGTVEIWSYGGAELDAALLDESGRLVASGQTIPDDWNFRVLAQVAPGRYLLHVTSPLALPAAAPQAPRQPAPQVSAEESSGDEDGADMESGDEEAPPGDEDSGDLQSDEEGDSGGSDMAVDESGAEEESSEPAPSVSVVSSQPLGGVSVVRLAVRVEKPVPAAAGSVDTTVDLGTEIAVVPFTTTQRGVYRLGGAPGAQLSAAVYRDGRLLASGPSPLRIPLADAGSYTLRYWTSSSLRASVRLRAELLPATDVSAEGALDARTSAVRLAFPAGTSCRVDAEAGPLLYSPEPDQPFRLLEEAAVSSTGSSAWVVRPDDAPVGACRVSLLALSDGTTEAVMIGSAEGNFQVRVPARTAALVRSENMGRAVGLSASAAGSTSSAAPAGYDWKDAGVEERASLLGLREGSFRGRLWDSSPGGGDRRIRLSAVMLGVESETALGKAQDLAVPGRSAAVLTLAPGQRAVEVSLDRGMIAFGWSNGPAGVVDAAADSTTGILEAAGGSVVVMNLLSTTGLCTAREAAAVIAPEISDHAAWETGRAGGDVVLNVRAAKAPSRLYVYGTAASAQLFSQEDGRVYTGEAAASDLGPLLAFPAVQGRLVLRGTSGPARAWIAAPDQVLSAFVGRDPRARQAPLPPEGAALQPSGQAWTMSLDADSTVLLRADGGGVLGMFNQAGACLEASASPGDRSLAAQLPRGTYTAYSRPFADAAGSAGMITARVLSPRTLDAEGPGAEALVGARDAILYRFTVSERGRVGCGVRARSDTVTAVLLDARFNALSAGRIFVRTLDAGVYYLLVQAGEQAQRFAPLVYGLKGNTARIPDDVMSSYQGE